ncbi:MAG TPA: hypothetical protein VK975_07015, partial [Acidimicrobiales bacterium]|nr:hypothetical protein [Acidimicrobiales bacterium]
VAAVWSGAALVAGSVCTRFAVFHAGIQSAGDPRYTVVPQRQRLEEGRAVEATCAPASRTGGPGVEVWQTDVREKNGT